MMSESSFDPYKPPDSPELGIQGMAALSELVRSWEKLRLAYYGILILPGLVVLAIWVNVASLPLGAAVFFSIFVGIGANAAFFLGPLAELYVRGFFRSGEILGKGRWLIFSAGLVVSGGVMAVAGMIPIFWRY